MAWPKGAEPVRMQRVALVAPVRSLREVLVRVADTGTVEIDRGSSPGASGTGVAAPGDAGRRLQQVGADRSREPRLSSTRPDLDALESEGRTDLLAGEAEVEACGASAVVRGEVAALAGWTPAGNVPALAAGLEECGGGVVPLRPPRGVDPPTLLRADGSARRSFSALVETYTTVPYVDIDPSLLAGLAYVFMFGMMFGDAGHGALLLIMGLLLWAGRPTQVARYRRLWPFVVGSGLTAMFFGLLYGEFFGPTGVLPVVWLSPLEAPVTLLGAALGVGAVLLAGAYVMGTVNRWREGGWPLALSAASGVAGAALFMGLGCTVLGAVTSRAWLVAVGVVVALLGIALAYVGFLAAAGGGAAGVTQASVEVFDSVLRVGTNVVSFARLAAFGLTHAALGQVVWDGSTSLWASGGLFVLAAIIVFLGGNALAFALEALVAGVQALRLEYYELFSRIFTNEGRPFRPWHIATDYSHTSDVGTDVTLQPATSGRQA